MTALPVPLHPILGCVAELGSTLDSVSDVQATYLSSEEKAAALRELAVLEARVVALRLSVMAVADDVAEQAGARDVAAWYAHRTLAEPEIARAELRVARSLDRDRPLVAGALAAGRCSLAQAQVIVRCLEELPARVGAEVIASAEATLVAYAEQFAPTPLRRLGRRILDVVAPEVAEAEDARRLESEERHAREKTGLSLRRLGDGTTRLTGRLPDGAASRLQTYLEAFASPRATNGSALDSALDSALAPADRMPYPRRLGQAFCSLLEHLDPAALPHHGGDVTTVMVTMTLDQLRAELATAGVLDGETETLLSAGEVRRLACTARILPAVLGGTSEVLDLGRIQRLFNAPQRKAMRLRDRVCRAEGCAVPAAWCEAHHLRPWVLGGRTDLAHGVLLCSHHHHRAHDQRYNADRMPNGDIRFTRRT
jgi:hypothetical protein